MESEISIGILDSDLVINEEDHCLGELSFLKRKVLMLEEEKERINKNCVMKVGELTKEVDKLRNLLKEKEEKQQIEKEIKRFKNDIQTNKISLSQKRIRVNENETLSLFMKELSEEEYLFFFSKQIKEEEDIIQRLSKEIVETKEEQVAGLIEGMFPKAIKFERKSLCSVSILLIKNIETSFNNRKILGIFLNILSHVARVFVSKDFIEFSNNKILLKNIIKKYYFDKKIINRLFLIIRLCIGGSSTLVCFVSNETVFLLSSFISDKYKKKEKKDLFYLQNLLDLMICFLNRTNSFSFVSDEFLNKLSWFCFTLSEDSFEEYSDLFLETLFMFVKKFEKRFSYSVLEVTNISLNKIIERKSKSFIF